MKTEINASQEAFLNGENAISGFVIPASIKIAVIIPCHNEAVTIGIVVSDFKRSLPTAAIFVCDNNSTDDTGAEAIKAGALVLHEAMQGKGNAVRRMFRTVDADFYLLVDGDDTYDSNIAVSMLKIAVEQKIDLVNCVRTGSESSQYRFGHRFGNRILTKIVGQIFGDRVSDMLSGYKVVSRRFVKSFPALSNGFDIETELTVHALELSLPISHISGDYRGRPEGSSSKLNTYKDGLRILRLIAILIKHERPMQLFSTLAFIFTLLSVILGLPVILNYLATGLVPRLPTAVLATGLILIAALSFATGLILDTVTRGRLETRMLAYLNHS